MSLSTTSLAAAAAAVLIQPQYPLRGIYPYPDETGEVVLPSVVSADAVIEEIHDDRLECTEHPVEVGASITDHAFKHPAHLVLRLGFSNSPPNAGQIADIMLSFGAAINTEVERAANALGVVGALVTSVSGSASDVVTRAYQTLLEIQATRTLFSVLTGRRSYINMVCERIHMETTEKTANAAIIVIECKQLVLVSTEVVTLDSSTQAAPSATAAPADRGTQNAVPSGTKVAPK